MQSIPEKDPGKLDMIVKRVSVPVGLEELMEGLTKEVLLKKPKDLYLFASEYFSKLIILRQRSSNHKAYPIRTVQSVTQVKTKETTPTSLPRPTRHLSRQLSVRGQAAPNQQKPVTQRSKERRTTADQPKINSVTQLVNRSSNQSTPRESKRTTPRSKAGKPEQIKSPTKSVNVKKDTQNGIEGSNRKVNIYKKKKESKKADDVKEADKVNAKSVPVQKSVDIKIDPLSITNQGNSNQIEHALAHEEAEANNSTRDVDDNKTEESISAGNKLNDVAQVSETTTEENLLLASTETAEKIQDDREVSEDTKNATVEFSESLDQSRPQDQNSTSISSGPEAQEPPTQAKEGESTTEEVKRMDTTNVQSQKKTNVASSISLINAEKLASTENTEVITGNNKLIEESDKSAETNKLESQVVDAGQHITNTQTDSDDQPVKTADHAKEVTKGELTSKDHKEEELLNNLPDDKAKIEQDEIEGVKIEPSSLNLADPNVLEPEETKLVAAVRETPLLTKSFAESSVSNKVGETSKETSEHLIMPSSETQVVSIEMKQMDNSDDVLIVSLSDQPSEPAALTELHPDVPESSTTNESNQKTQFFRKDEELVVPQNLLGHLRQAVGLHSDHQDGRVDSPIKDFLHTFIKNEQNHVFASKSPSTTYNAAPIKSTPKTFNSVKDLLELDVTIPKDDSSETSSSDTKSLQLIIVDENSSDGNAPKVKRSATGEDVDDLGSYAEDSVVVEHRGLIGQETLRGLSLGFKDSKTDSSSKSSGDVTDTTKDEDSKQGQSGETDDGLSMKSSLTSSNGKEILLSSGNDNSTSTQGIKVDDLQSVSVKPQSVDQQNEVEDTILLTKDNSTTLKGDNNIADSDDDIVIVERIKPVVLKESPLDSNEDKTEVSPHSGRLLNGESAIENEVVLGEHKPRESSDKVDSQPEEVNSTTVETQISSSEKLDTSKSEAKLLIENDRLEKPEHSSTEVKNSIDRSVETGENKVNRRPKIGEIEQVASVIEVVKNMSSLEKTQTTIPPTVNDYLTNFLQSEQNCVFQPEPCSQIPQPIKRTSKLISKTKPERSLSHSNMHGNDKDREARMKRARSVGVIKTKEGSSSIPTSARRSAGRRPLVRQPEASSKELAEKLNFTRSKSSEGESSHSDKANSGKSTNKRNKQSKIPKEGIAKKVVKTVEKLAGQVLNISQIKDKDQAIPEKEEADITAQKEANAVTLAEKFNDDNAATKIQSAWKGFSTRKNLKESNTKKLRAVLRIQAVSRGFLERMRYRQLKVRRKRDASENRETNSSFDNHGSKLEENLRTEDVNTDEGIENVKEEDKGATGAKKTAIDVIDSTVALENQIEKVESKETANLDREKSQLEPNENLSAKEDATKDTKADDNIESAVESDRTLEATSSDQKNADLKEENEVSSDSGREKGNELIEEPVSIVQDGNNGLDDDDGKGENAKDKNSAENHINSAIQEYTKAKISETVSEVKSLESEKEALVQETAAVNDDSKADITSEATKNESGEVNVEEPNIIKPMDSVVNAEQIKNETSTNNLTEDFETKDKEEPTGNETSDDVVRFDRSNSKENTIETGDRKVVDLSPNETNKFSTTEINTQDNVGNSLVKLENNTPKNNVEQVVTEEAGSKTDSKHLKKAECESSLVQSDNFLGQQTSLGEPGNIADFDQGISLTITENLTKDQSDISTSGQTNQCIKDKISKTDEQREEHGVDTNTTNKDVTTDANEKENIEMVSFDSREDLTHSNNKIASLSESKVTNTKESKEKDNIAENSIESTVHDKNADNTVVRQKRQAALEADIPNDPNREIPDGKDGITQSITLNNSDNESTCTILEDQNTSVDTQYKPKVEVVQDGKTVSSGEGIRKSDELKDDDKSEENYAEVKKNAEGIVDQVEPKMDHNGASLTDNVKAEVKPELEDAPKEELKTGTSGVKSGIALDLKTGTDVLPNDNEIENKIDEELKNLEDNVEVSSEAEHKTADTTTEEIKREVSTESLPKTEDVKSKRPEEISTERYKSEVEVVQDGKTVSSGEGIRKSDDLKDDDKSEENYAEVKKNAEGIVDQVAPKMDHNDASVTDNVKAEVKPELDDAPKEELKTGSSEVKSGMDKNTVPISSNAKQEALDITTRTDVLPNDTEIENKIDEELKNLEDNVEVSSEAEHKIADTTTEERKREVSTESLPKTDDVKSKRPEEISTEVKSNLDDDEIKDSTRDISINIDQDVVNANISSENTKTTNANQGKSNELNTEIENKIVKNLEDSIEAASDAELKKADSTSEEIKSAISTEHSLETVDIKQPEEISKEGKSDIDVDKAKDSTSDLSSNKNQEAVNISILSKDTLTQQANQVESEELITKMENENEEQVIRKDPEDNVKVASEAEPKKADSTTEEIQNVVGTESLVEIVKSEQSKEGKSDVNADKARDSICDTSSIINPLVSTGILSKDAVSANVVNQDKSDELNTETKKQVEGEQVITKNLEDNVKVASEVEHKKADSTTEEIQSGVSTEPLVEIVNSVQSEEGKPDVHADKAKTCDSSSIANQDTVNTDILSNDTVSTNVVNQDKSDELNTETKRQIEEEQVITKNLEDNVKVASEAEHKKADSTPEEIHSKVAIEPLLKQSNELKSGSHDDTAVDSTCDTISSNVSQDAVGTSISSKDTVTNSSHDKLDLVSAEVEDEAKSALKKVAERLEDGQSVLSKVESELEGELKNKVDEEQVMKDVEDQVESGVETKKGSSLTSQVKGEISVESHGEDVSKEESEKSLRGVKSEIQDDKAKDSSDSSFNTPSNVSQDVKDATNVEVPGNDILKTSEGKPAEADIESTAEDNATVKKDYEEGKDTLISAGVDEKSESEKEEVTNETSKKLLDMLGNHIGGVAQTELKAEVDDIVSNNVTVDTKVDPNQAINTEKDVESKEKVNASESTVKQENATLNKDFGEGKDTLISAGINEESESKPKKEEITNETSEKLLDMPENHSGDAQTELKAEVDNIVSNNVTADTKVYQNQAINTEKEVESKEKVNASESTAEQENATVEEDYGEGQDLQSQSKPRKEEITNEASKKLLDMPENLSGVVQDATNVEVPANDILKTSEGKPAEADIESTAEDNATVKKNYEEGKDTLISAGVDEKSESEKEEVTNETSKKLLDMPENHIGGVAQTELKSEVDNIVSNNVTADTKVDQNQTINTEKDVETKEEEENAILQKDCSYQDNKASNLTAPVMNKQDKTESEVKEDPADAKITDILPAKPSEEQVESDVDQKASLKVETKETDLNDNEDKAASNKVSGSQHFLEVKEETNEKPPINIDTSDDREQEITNEVNPKKPDFYRADTVVEPILVKKTIQHLGDDSQDDQTDDNNNSNKDETTLEKEVREAVDEVIKQTQRMDAEAVDALLQNLPSVPTDEQPAAIITSKAESTESEPVADDLSSVDSADSVVTVIMKPKQEQEHTRPLPSRAFSTSALEDHVELLDQVQNSLLDELSGKNSKGKFDIEQLRKELHDAATLYKDDEEPPVPTVAHEPEMLEYLYDFEPEDPACFDRVPKTRELPDILEEEDSSEMSSNLTNEIIINDDHIEIGKEHHRLMHTGEMHDSVLVNNSLGGLVVGKQEQQNQLKHTSEFHDTVLVPLPSGADVKITNASRETSPQNQQASDLADRMDSGNQTSNQQPPAGVKAVTSRRIDTAQPSLKDTAPAGLGSAGPAQSPTRIANEAMESESNNNNNKKNNAITNNVPEKNMEVEAATKIQAGFRGYQVRKQLKAKTAAIDQKRQLRKRSSKDNMKNPELEEKSAVKIQAGVRGFLVRRRQKKQSNNSSASA